MAGLSLGYVYGTPDIERNTQPDLCLAPFELFSMVEYIAYAVVGAFMVAVRCVTRRLK